MVSCHTVPGRRPPAGGSTGDRQGVDGPQRPGPAVPGPGRAAATVTVASDCDWPGQAHCNAVAFKFLVRPGHRDRRRRGGTEYGTQRLGSESPGH
jgi:hypothetical protein